MTAVGKKQGFTLIELIMVVAIIAIIALLAINKLSGLQKEAKEKINLANLKRISSGIETYIAANGENLNFDKMDSLTKWSNHAKGTPGDTSRLASKGDLLLYTNQAGNVGLSTALFGSANPFTSNKETLIGQYCLSETDVAVLEHDLGLKFLFEGTDGARNRVGDDGAWAQGEIANPDKCSSVAVSNYPGRVVAVVNPGATSGSTPVGCDIYKSVGQDVAYTYTGKIMVGGAEQADNLSAFKALMSGEGILMAFGLGENCALIGNNKSGFDSAPKCPVMNSDEYRRYIILVRVKYSAGKGGTYSAVSAEYAGVMDPAGNVATTLK